MERNWKGQGQILVQAWPGEAQAGLKYRAEPTLTAQQDAVQTEGEATGAAAASRTSLPRFICYLRCLTLKKLGGPSPAAIICARQCRSGPGSIHRIHSVIDPCMASLGVNIDHIAKLCARPRRASRTRSSHSGAAANWAEPNGITVHLREDAAAHISSGNGLPALHRASRLT